MERFDFCWSENSASIKLWIVNYYEFLQNCIDTEAESQLAYFTLDDESELADFHESVNSTRQMLLDEIERIRASNLADYAANERELNVLFDEFKKTAFTSESPLFVKLKQLLFRSGFCAYICKLTCNTFIKSCVLGFGLLISSTNYFAELYYPASEEYGALLYTMQFIKYLC